MIGPKRTFDGLIIMPDGKKVFLPSSGKVRLMAAPYENGTMNVILTPPGIEYKKDTGNSEGSVLFGLVSLVLIYQVILHLLHWVVS